MRDLRSALRDAGDSIPPPVVDLAALHVRAQRLRRRRAVAATLAVALIATATGFTAQSFLNRSERGVDFVAPQPSSSPHPGSASPSPSPDPGTDSASSDPMTIATSDDGRWRLVVGRRHGALCAQLLGSDEEDEEFDPTFCGAYEAEVDTRGVAAAFGGSESSPDAFSYGMVAAEAVTVRVELGDGRTIAHDTVLSRDFPDVRFFLVQLPAPFPGVNAVAAVDRTGRRVGHVDLRGEDDV